MVSAPFEIVVLEQSSFPADPGAVALTMAALLDLGFRVHRNSGSSESSQFSAPDDGAVGGKDSPKRSFLVLGNFQGKAPVFEATDGESTIAAEDISGLATEEILAIVERHKDGRALNSPSEKGTWKPWFPVIDYDRCTNCMQCLSFCLFDVYGVDDAQRIQVQNNDNCKTNCPACSRVCPEVAIMFPKYSGGPINGDAVSESDLNREKMKVDISSLLGGDIYASLRDRSEKAKSRFSTERDSDKALNERKRCLTKLQSDGLIPAEVLAEIDLASLPSPEEIKRKSEELARLQEDQDTP